MISIIIPVFNGEKTLADTLKSIEQQTWRDFEVIVVNNQSVDNTQKVFENFSKNNNLNYLGIEYDKEIYELAKERLGM